MSPDRLALVSTRSDFFAFNWFKAKSLSLKKKLIGTSRAHNERRDLRELNCSGFFNPKRRKKKERSGHKYIEERIRWTSVSSSLICFVWLLFVGRHLSNMSAAFDEVLCARALSMGLPWKRRAWPMGLPWKKRPRHPSIHPSLRALTQSSASKTRHYHSSNPPHDSSIFALEMINDARCTIESQTTAKWKKAKSFNYSSS